MGTHHEAQEQRALDWFGLRPSTARPCPLVVARKQCRADDGECICLRHHRLLDHARTWLDQHGRHVLTGEPYDATGDDLSTLITDMESLGLKVSLSGRSTWNPGYALLIRITGETQRETPAQKGQDPSSVSSVSSGGTHKTAGQTAIGASAGDDPATCTDPVSPVAGTHLQDRVSAGQTASTEHTEDTEDTNRPAAPVFLSLSAPAQQTRGNCPKCAWPIDSNAHEAQCGAA